MSDTIPFGIPYEERLIACLLRDKHFFLVWYSIFDSKYLNSEINKNMVDLIKMFGEKYKRPPDQAELEVICQEFIAEKEEDASRGSQEWALYNETIKTYFKFSISELEFIKDNALKYLQQKACETAVLECAKLIGSTQAFKMPDIMQQALNIGTNVSSFGLDYFADRKARALRRYSSPREFNRIPFFIPKFDEIIGGVGFRENKIGIPELLLFGGGYGVGKSRSIGHMVRVAAALGHNVFVASSEMAEDLYAERLDMGYALLDTPGLYETSNFDHLQRRLDLFANQGAKVFIKKYPAGTATIRETVSLIRLIEQQLGINFQMVAWDYTGEFKAENKHGERRDAMAEIVRSQKTAVDELECAGVGAFQLNRQGFSAEMADLDHAAEDITAAKVADTIIIMGQNEEEYAMQPPQMRWCARKVRAQEKNQTVLLIDDRSHMQFRQHPDDGMPPKEIEEE